MALDLIAPEVPDAQKNLGAHLLLQGLGTGLAAMAKFAEVRRQSEDELLKLATQERIAQDQHAFEREKLYKDASVQDELMKAHADMYRNYGDAAMIRANAAARNSTNVVAFNQQKEELINDVNDQADKLKLNDPEFATKEPVKFAANVMQFKDMFGLSPIPEVKNAIRQFQSIADQQKITLKSVDADGNPIGNGKDLPIWQVVKNLQDPNTKDQTVSMLKAGGYYTEKSEKVPGVPTKSWSRPIDSAWDWLIGPTPKTVEKDVPSAALEGVLNKSKDVQFQHVPSRVPPAMLKRTDARGTSPTDLPSDSSQPDPLPDQTSFAPTQTDTYLMHAKAAIAQGAPMGQVAQRLQELGIDPSQMWAT